MVPALPGASPFLDVTAPLHLWLSKRASPVTRDFLLEYPPSLSPEVPHSCLEGFNPFPLDGRNLCLHLTRVTNVSQFVRDFPNFSTKSPTFQEAPPFRVIQDSWSPSILTSKL